MSGSTGEGEPASLEERITRVSSELTTLVAEVEELTSEVTPEHGMALVAVEHLAPSEVKGKMAAARSAIMAKRAAIASRQEEMKALLQAKMDEVNAVVGPMQAAVKRLEEGIWSVNLYLGKDEVVTQLADGEAADPDVPITVRQLVLAMDEECAVAAEDGGIDAQSIESFDEWLLADPAHVHQIIPEEKGIVALVPRWSDKDYGSPWEAAAMAQANRQTYFLIRNGQKLYRYVTDFVAGERLVPNESEFTDCFYGTRLLTDGRLERVALKEGTREWADAEAAADKRRRHYMRVGLILQGLVDRTPILHPLPGPVRFLEVEDYDAGRIVVIMNGERLLTDGREGFADWQARLMGELRPGMRIIGAFEAYRSREQWGIWPEGASLPESFVPHAVTEELSGGRLKILYDRSDRIWDDEWRPVPGRPGYERRTLIARPPERRASCVFHRGSDLVLPFDLAAAEDIERFLRSRTERRHYLTMFPLLKAALRAKRAEAEIERPFRSLLAGLLADRNGVAIDEAEAVIDELASWWKVTNRHHRPLVGAEEDNAKAVRMIVAEHRRRIEDARRPHPPGLVAKLEAAHPGALLIARKRDGSYVVLEPQDDGDTFVTETTYGVRGKVKGREEWRLVGTRPARWTIAHQSPAFERWNTMASPAKCFTGPEIDELVRRLVARTDDATPPVAVMLIDGTHGDRHAGTALAVLEVDFERAWVDREHLLTVRQGSVEVSAEVYSPVRRSDGSIELASRWGYRYPTGDAWPCWEPTGRYNSSWRRVYLDRDVARCANEARERCASVAAEVRALEHQRWGYEATVAHQWNEAEERRAFRAFLEDYRDPDLWEGHRKTLKLRTLSPGLRDFGDVHSALDVLLERGERVAGRTVQEVVETARSLGCGGYWAVPDGLDGLVFEELDSDHP